MERKKIIGGAVIAVLILVIILTQTCKKPKNDVIEDISVPISQNTEQLYINDSLKAVKQSILLAESKQTINNLQDSIEKIVSAYAQIKPTTVIRYVENSTYKDKVGQYQDSLSTLIDTLISLKNQNVEYTKYINSKTIPYVISDKWFTQKGSFDLKGSIKIDSLKIISEPYVILGEKGKWYQRKTITALVGNKNPNIVQNNLQSFTYKPKTPVQFSGGPVILTNGTQTSVGAGITIKKGLLSLTVGYQLKNLN